LPETEAKRKNAGRAKPSKFLAPHALQVGRLQTEAVPTARGEDVVDGLDEELARGRS